MVAGSAGAGFGSVAAGDLSSHLFGDGGYSWTDAGGDFAIGAGGGLVSAGVGSLAGRAGRTVAGRAVVSRVQAAAAWLARNIPGPRPKDLSAITCAGTGDTVAAETGVGVDRGDGRDALGHFTGKGSYGAGAQAQGLADYTTATGRSVIGDQVRATLPDGSIRYFDGLSINPDGTYQGVEVKGGSAGLTASQRAFDGQVDGGVSATATLGGASISITSTYLVRVP